MKQKRTINTTTKKTVNHLSECGTIGCEKLANRKGAGLCEACYMRMRRRGTTAYKRPFSKRLQSAGYVWIWKPEHPLSKGNGLYEHRYIYYENNGKGPFECYWCGKFLIWSTMHIDHLDDVRHNNTPENLVASCPECNKARGRHKMVKTKRAQGRQITYNGETKCVSEWAKYVGISDTAMARRIEQWSLEDALTAPRGKFGPKPGYKSGHNEGEL